VEDGQGLHKGFKRGSAGEEDHHHHHQLPELPLGLQSASPQTMMPVSSTMVYVKGIVSLVIEVLAIRRRCHPYHPSCGFKFLAASF